VKKYARIAAIGVAASLALTACASGTPEEPSSAGDLSGSVTMWAYPLSADKDEAFWADTTADFKKLHPDVDVKVTVQPWANRDQLLTTAIAGGTAPDAFYIIGGQVGTYQDLGALAPLDEYVTKEELEDFNDSALNAARIDDSLYMMPELQGSMLVAYNKKAFDAAGIAEYPTTWKELQEAAPKLKSAGYYLMEYQANVGTLNHNFLPFFWQAGGQLFSKDGKKAAFNSKAGKETLNFIKGLVDDGYIPQELLTELRTNMAIPSAHTAKGDVAIQPLADNAAATGIIEAWGEDGVVFGAPLKGPAAQTSYGLVAGYAMLAGAKNKAATAEWLKYITSKEVMPGVIGLLNGLPARKSLSNVYPEGSPFHPFVKYLDKVRENDQNPRNRDVMTILEPQIQAVMIGEKSVEQALADAEAEANRALDR
jgi:multiple sugar transport system substrate-binding protein